MRQLKFGKMKTKDKQTIIFGFAIMLSASVFAQHDFTEPDVSPNGKHLVYCSNKESKNAIYISDADGHKERKLVDLEGYESTPNWSPTGKKIVFYLMDDNAKSDMYIINSDGTDLRKVEHKELVNPGSVTWINKKEIMFSSGNFPKSNVFKLNLHSNKLVQLTDENGLNYYPDLNKNVLTYCKLSRQKDGMHTGIFKMDLKSKKSTMLSNQGEAPVFTKDAEKIIYQGKSSKEETTGLRVIDLETGAIKPLTSNAELSELPDIDHKNKRVYYQRKINDKFSIWRINMDGTGNVQIIGN